MLVYLNNFLSEEQSLSIYGDLQSIKGWEKRDNIDEDYHQLFLPKSFEGPRRKFFELLKKKAHTLISIVQSLYPSSIDFFNDHYLDFFKYETYSKIGPHVDTRNIDGYKNFVTLIYYLNEDYYGGLVRVYEEEKCVLKVAPKAGDAIILTQDIKHESTTLKSGNKYIAIQHWGYN